MSERRGFKDQISDVLTESLPDASGGTLEKWLAPTTESRIEQIPVEQIRDRAVRGEVDVTEPAFRALRASIRASGVLQPLLLRPHSEGGYEVVSGARRLRAARDTAQSTVPAVVRELNDAQALVGGSWDAVLRTGLTPRESAALAAELVVAGMGEGEAAALVGTAPVREEAPDEAGAVAAEPVAEQPVSEAPEAAVEPAPAAEAVPTAVEPAATAPEAEEPAAEEAATQAAPAEDPAMPAPEAEAPPVPELEVDEDSLGWPTPDEAPAETAPTSPPEPLPIDPTRFPVATVPVEDGEISAVAEAPPIVDAGPNGAAPAEPLVEAPAAEAAAPAAAAAEPDVPASEAPSAAVEAAAPEAQTPESEAAAAEAVAPDAAEPDATSAETQPAAQPLDAPVVVVAPADASAAAGVTPHVIRINLPDPSTAVATEAEPSSADGSMPVAAPAAGAAEAEPGSRLITPPAAESEPSAPVAQRPVPVPAVLRRGPLFYAVLGIGLAVGAIVFILTSVLEGVGGTTSIIAAVVVAVAGFVTAMVSLAQPRPRS
ncbi:MAG TPA: ParB/RepB/Spo0J family partition protein [Candidatus Dormibacteraeota bacterium]|nr:ParB/RepB/Spo0J family partition protein [Candidatus Dormibacteraeota bacterium]